MNIYIPQGIDFEEIETKWSLKRKIEGYKRDKLAYILHLFTELPIYNRRLFFKNGYIPLNSSILQDRLGAKYTQYLNFLLEAAILYSNGSYVVSAHSRLYKLNPIYSYGVKPYELSDFTFKSSLIRFYDRAQLSSFKRYRYLEKSFKHLEIDVLAALKHIRREYKLKISSPEQLDIKQGKNKNKKLFKDPKLQYNCAKTNVLNIYNKEFGIFKVDTSGHRFHSVLTNMNSGLRKFLTFNEKTLVSFDIKNSQPYFSTALLEKNFWEKEILEPKFKPLFLKMLTNNKHITPSIMLSIIDEILSGKDIQLYKDLVRSGEFYDYFQAEYNTYYGEHLTRGEIKEQMFTNFFSSNRFNHKIEAKGRIVFKKLFPSVNRLFCLIKAKENNTLALLLQRIESKYVLDGVCETATYMSKMPLFTIHDSIITTEEYANDLEKIIINVLRIGLGEAPTLKKEIWLNPKFIQSNQTNN